ncbi:MAG: hypothetical protein HY755_02205 [Nitrospirae bacterium]|nr:hypothetical protein [Nitrospirota bacterium]
MVSKRGTLTNLKRNPSGKEEYDSALEREYMVELERNPAVKTWTKKHGIKIPYKFFGITRHYWPDFMVEYKDGSKEIHETKGLPLLLWLSTKLKGQTAEEFCKAKGWKYKMITKGSQAFYGKV